MTYITIDGDDIGRRITGMYLSNDPTSLSGFAAMIQVKVHEISELLMSHGFQVIFCAADGVVAHSALPAFDEASIYKSIELIGAGQLTFSAGVGKSLREAYVALLAAKSSGKARLVRYEDIG